MNPGVFLNPNMNMNIPFPGPEKVPGPPQVRYKPDLTSPDLTVLFAGWPPVPPAGPPPFLSPVGHSHRPQPPGQPLPGRPERPRARPCASALPSQPRPVEQPEGPDGPAEPGQVSPAGLRLKLRHTDGAALRATNTL